jgi:GGDEF domain-containing protein
VVLEGIRGEGEALALAARLMEALEEPFEVGEAGEKTLSASVGVALSTLPHGCPEDLLRLADLAMYRSKKREGQGRLFVHAAPL